ncbi:MarR family winged helix-turn-helix transcriptional regulator [Leucobacter allii]|uniref:MarR family winged helix-turn-helix transcriptional regulator n=1 Tax=Leucobacter allii TaxID=2932247 RepID=A0ABY4FM91_9MICO|nr:MarR family winged helix-turn-helix transcriptional regulator [Leucobacter allii]UOQ57379.1 MarR family winged helix-turn-helix transcriptional regulator [Leucobacter allii]
MGEMTEAAPEIRQLAARRGLVVERLPDTIDRDSYTPALLGLLNNILLWGGSRVFHRRHGIGTNEWRIVSALGNWPGATAKELCELLGINKSVASKSVKLLLEREDIAQLDGPRGSRHLYLTAQGARVHDDCMPIALDRQRILLESLSPEEVGTLNALLVRMLDSSASMQAYERDIVSDAS